MNLEESQENVRTFLLSMQLDSLMSDGELYTFHTGSLRISSLGAYSFFGFLQNGLFEGAYASNLDWLTKESPSKGFYEYCCENSFEKHREACFGGKNCTFFAKKLITHSFKY